MCIFIIKKSSLSERHAEMLEDLAYEVKLGKTSYLFIPCDADQTADYLKEYLELNLSDEEASELETIIREKADAVVEL